MNETYEERKVRETKADEVFQATMVQVPAYMPGWTMPGWTWNNLDHEERPMKGDGYLIGPNDEKISVRYDIWHNRISISSVYPHNRSSYGKAINITVSPTKTPKQIARDLEKRFLHLYLPELAAHRDRIKKADEYEANKTAMMQKIADYLGVEIHERGNLYPLHVMEVYCIEPQNEDTVKFSVECSAEQAIKVFEVLKQS